jgi:hypothetical protein
MPGCAGQVTPVGEDCNGVDDNCNGVVDDGLPWAGTECDKTAAANGVHGICKNQARWWCKFGTKTCVPGQPEQEKCDGKDNDCDGDKDEGNLCGKKKCVNGDCVKK